MSDLILNIICSEQDLAQQKVALGMCMMNPAMKGRQYHLSYDLVKLTTGKMSGRRGRYLLADDLYQDLKDIIKEKMAKKSEDKGEKVDEKAFESVTHEVSAAAMKYALLSCACQTQINFENHRFRGCLGAVHPLQLHSFTISHSQIRIESRHWRASATRGYQRNGI
jgi:arginyl-tRNA synthetase